MYLLETSETKTNLVNRIKACFSEQALGEVVDNILSSSLLLDILCLEGISLLLVMVIHAIEESPLVTTMALLLPFLLNTLRKFIHVLPIIRFLCSHIEISLLYVVDDSFLNE